MEKLKRVLRKNPVVISIALNILSWLFFIYSLKYDKYILFIPMIFSICIGRWLLEQGECLNRSKSLIIYISYFAMALICLFSFDWIIK